MKKKTPLVSVIVPAYNAEKFIAESIQSVIDQTYNNWELVIVNDGSTDNTLSVVKRFTDPRVLVMSQKNSGVSAARNRGLEKCKGSYITFLDADDTLPPESIEKRVAYLEANPNVDLVDGHISVRDHTMQHELRRYTPYYRGELLPRLLKLDDRVFFNICYFFRKDILGDTRFETDMSHAEDLFFYIALASKRPVQYGFVDKLVYNYRSGHISAMSNIEGLERGYVVLLQKIDKISRVTLYQKYYLKIKIAKIMFLSYLHHKKKLKAFKSLFHILLTKNHKEII